MKVSEARQRAVSNLARLCGLKLKALDRMRDGAHRYWARRFARMAPRAARQFPESALLRDLAQVRP